jgi:hypothetical protein
MYGGEVALTPHCSYTDGRRGPQGYSYQIGARSPKEESLKPGEGGNHMWGVSAHGALGYAEDGKSWDWILKHYYSGVKIDGAY